MLKKLAIILIILTGSISLSAVERIVSLAPSVTTTLYDLGVGDKIVGCTTYCDQAIADGVDIVASVVTVNIEKIVSLNPDIVIAASLTKPKSIKALEQFGIKVIHQPLATNYQEITEHFLDIAKSVGEDSVAKKRLQECSEEIELIREDLKQNRSFNIFFQIGSSPIYAVVGNNFMNDYIKMCNGKNPYEDLSSGKVTRESVMINNPEIIIITTMGIQGEAEKKIWQKYDEIEAVKMGNLYTIDSDLACNPTPATYIESLKLVKSFIDSAAASYKR